MLKKDLRKLYLQKRKELSPNERENRSEMICKLLFGNYDLNGKVLSLFLPIESKNEINTYKILELGLSLDVRIGIPKVDPSNHLLKHYYYESMQQLETSEWGIPEPKGGKAVPIKDIDFVLVPLLTFDKNGHRVGYGKGFYDAFLKKCSPKCQFIGLSFFNDPVIIDDLLPNDTALHACITPQKVYRF